MVSFEVIRRCPPDECEPECNCGIITVSVDVDELREDEIARFVACGSEAQRAEIAAWLAPAEDALSSQAI